MTTEADYEALSRYVRDVEAISAKAKAELRVLATSRSVELDRLMPGMLAEYRATQAHAEALAKTLERAAGLLKNADTMHANGGFCGDNIDRWLINVGLILSLAHQELAAYRARGDA